MMISFERGGNLRHGGPLNARRSSLVNRLGANRLQSLAVRVFGSEDEASATLVSRERLF
jgi:hypothetical protein